nr:MAG TPA: hypothetical protein [Caudoviricetes sp.]
MVGALLLICPRPKQRCRGKSYHFLVRSLMSTHEYIYPYTHE